MDGQKIWSNILSGIKMQVSASIFKTWFAGSYVLDFKKSQDRNFLIVAFKNNFLKEQVEARYLEQITRIATRTNGAPLEVIFVVAQKEKREITKNDPIFSGVPQSYSPNLRKTEVLNPNHNFENFVVGSSNNLAYLAAKKVAGNLGSTYNPLLLWGPTGVGKTHLLQAVGNEVLISTVNSKVIYVSAEKFTNEYIESLNNKTQAMFRQKYRNVDLLLVDDIQFLAGKESTQDEFFHTFCELELSGKQVVVASDHHPRELGRLKERLVSRFLGGMTADIGMPDLEMRVAILKSKCQGRGFEISDEIIAHLAQCCEGNPRELEGALISVLARFSLSGGKMEIEEVKELIEKNKSLHHERPTQVAIINAVCGYFKLRPQDLSGPSRKSHLVLPRQILMYLLRKELHLPLGQIGAILGGRDHSTIIYGLEKVERTVSRDVHIKDELTRIQSLFNNK